MADRDRNQSDDDRSRLRAEDEHPDRSRGSIFGSGWTGLGGSAREDDRHLRDTRPEGRIGDAARPDGDRDDRGSDPDRSERSDRGEMKRGGGVREGDWSFDRSEGGDRMRRDRGYGHDDRNDGLPIEETSRLIASNKVEGTQVYSRDGEKLGTIYNFMVDKHTGQVEYAVMAYGGLLGMGQRHYPLPWRVLTYHTDVRGYVIGMEARDLKDAPSFGREDEPAFDRSYGEKVHGWWGTDR